MCRCHASVPVAKNWSADYLKPLWVPKTRPCIRRKAVTRLEQGAASSLASSCFQHGRTEGTFKLSGDHRPEFAVPKTHNRRQLDQMRLEAAHEPPAQETPHVTRCVGYWLTTS